VQARDVVEFVEQVLSGEAAAQSGRRVAWHGVTGRPLRYAAIARTSARPVTVALAITVTPLLGVPSFVSTSVATVAVAGTVSPAARAG
jgi:hypothetical protein